jgi:hypothetical protein
MKKILQIIIFLFSIGIFACTCEVPKITEKYIESDFVAKARIIKNYKNETSKELYKADLIITELFKGEIQSSIYVAGRSDGKKGSSCAIFIPENTELIIYARKDKDGKYVIGMCSGLLYLNNRNYKRQKRELDILKMFKSQNINFTDKINYREKAKLNKELEKFKGIDLKKSYGIYEITFASDLTIKNVIEINGFGNPVDLKLIEIINKTEWSSFDKGIKDKVPENSKFLIGIYYYEKEKDKPSFLSPYYL